MSQKLRNSYLILFIMVTFFSFCSKDKLPPYQSSYPIIYPEDYLPLYPGSWWKYKGRNNSIIEFNTFPCYMLDSSAYNTPMRVPVWNTQIFSFLDSAYKQATFKMYGYAYYTIHYGTSCGNLQYNKGYLKYFLKENLYSRWVVSCWANSQGFHNTVREIRAVDTTIILNNIVYNNVIIVEEYEENPYDTIKLWYYAKNIGLIKRVDFNYDSIEIIDYHINTTGLEPKCPLQ